ncbi:MAG: hypothetical protein FJ388_01005 [Verrucomicrobia bacterium]|nr:hypothetical protein [Verrucomicrobiota bacterium]
MKHSVLKILALIVALGVAAPMLVPAGEKNAEGKRGARGAAMMAKLDEALGKLSLTEVQKTKIEACKAKYQEYVKAHGEEFKAARGGADEQKKREAKKGWFEKWQEMMDGIRAVLTDEQKKKLEEAMPARGARGDRGKPGAKRGGEVVQ